MSTPKLGDGILAAQTSTSIVAGSSFEAVTLGAAHVAFGSRLCENVLEPRMRRIAFSISFSRQSWKVQLVFTSTKSRRNFYTQVERQSFHTAWVNFVVLTLRHPLPFHPYKQTCSESVGMSQRCQTQTSKPQVRRHDLCRQAPANMLDFIPND
jgi:hypothetical protein